MYGYENIIDYMPATEGAIKDWISGIGHWIYIQDKKIKTWLTEINRAREEDFDDDGWEWEWE